MSTAPFDRPRIAVLLTAGLMVSSMATVFASPLEPAAAVELPREPDSGPAADPDPQERFETSSSERPVAPGVTLTSFDSYGPDAVTGEEGAGWLQGSVLTADLTGDVSMDRIFPGEVAAREELTAQADRAGAIAAVNASYFDISTTGAPWGVGAQGGEIVQSPHIDDPNGACNECSVYVTEEGMAAVGEILFEGTISLPGGETVPLDELNKPRFQVSDGIMAFTPVWGEGTRNGRMEPGEPKIEVVVTDGVVSEVLSEPGSDRVAEGTFTLVGRGTGVDVLSQLAVGDEVSISYDFRSADDQRLRAAASGRQILVAEGVAQEPRVNSSDPDPHPRTAVGFSADGNEMYMLTVDGRQPEFSAGVSLDELARMMVDLGAYTAVNFDGGGSATMVARTPGADQVDLVNRPSEFDDDEVRDEDFSQRPVPDGLGLFVPEGSGELDGFWLATRLEPEQAVGASYAPRLRTERVFPGLTRAVTATPYDETYGPAEAPGSELAWSVSDESVGSVDADGVFTAAAPGEAIVAATAGGVQGEFEVSVLGELSQLSASSPQLFLPEADDVAEVVLSGQDAQGYSAPIEPADVQLDYDESLLTVEPTADGRFQVSAAPFSGVQPVTFTVAGVSTTVQVSTERDGELEEVVVEDFEGIGSWDLWTMRATGDWSPAAEGQVGSAGALSYDFTTSDETRGIGIWPADGFFPLDGEPVELRLQVNSDPVGMRARIEIADATGVIRTVEPGFVTESGWQQLTYEVPDEVTYPISLRRIYFNEIYPEQSYEGRTLVDELTVVRPELPDAQEQAPPAVLDAVRTDATAPPAGRQLAVISQLGIDAADPDGPALEQAREALREARNSGVELVIVNSGFVAEGNPASLELARDILDTELAGIDYHYIPGAAERFGGSLDAFEEVFGAAEQTVDLGSTRILTLDTSAGNYLASDWHQLPDLAAQLEQAEDDAVEQLIVVQSQPLHDRVPPATDQLSDRKEADTVQRWLSDFQERTSTEVLLLGGAGGTFDAMRAEGVLQVTSGAATPALASGAPYGGFAGWSLIDVAADGYGVTFLPWADQVSLDGPTQIAAGDRVPIGGTALQGETESALGYPMAVDWSSSRQVYIGDPEDLDDVRRYAAVYDPSTGELTALRRGVATLRATIDGQSAELIVRIRP